MRPDDIVRLTHMRDAAASALRFIDGKERADLDRNEMLLFALVRAVEVIGEAAAKVSAISTALSQQRRFQPLLALFPVRHYLSQQFEKPCVMVAVSGVA